MSSTLQFFTLFFFIAQAFLMAKSKRIDFLLGVVITIITGMVWMVYYEPSIYIPKSVPYGCVFAVLLLLSSLFIILDSKFSLKIEGVAKKVLWVIAFIGLGVYLFSPTYKNFERQPISMDEAIIITHQSVITNGL